MKMYTSTILLSVLVGLGASLPMFPVARPYIPSGLGPLPSITTNAYIVPRGLVNTEGEIATGPIPDKRKHTHGTLSPETGAEKAYMGGDCGENNGGCANSIEDIIDKAKEDLKKQLQEELDDRDLGDCKEGMWGC